MTVKEKIVAITGGGSGIGRCIAKTMAAQGAFVVITDINLEWATTVVDEIGLDGGEAIALKLDVTERRDVTKSVRAIVERWGRIDIWCNNAGVSTMAPFLAVTDEQWDFNMSVNTKGVFVCSQVVAECMVKQSIDTTSGLRGKLINTASMAGQRGGVEFLAPYITSKFGVIGMTQAMAAELARYQITVNAVCPGYVRTPMQERELEWEARLRQVKKAEVQSLFIADTPLGRLQQPEDVAAAVAFLASDDANYMTGQALGVNGGAWIR